MVCTIDLAKGILITVSLHVLVGGKDTDGQAEIERGLGQAGP